jgi:hypothetical protein
MPLGEIIIKIAGSRATCQFFGTLIQGINATKNSWEQSDMSIFIRRIIIKITGSRATGQFLL